MKPHHVSLFPLFLAVACVSFAAVVVAEPVTLVGEAVWKPGLLVTEFPRHAAQVDADHLLLPREQFGKGIGENYVVESLAPWKWNTERNAQAMGLLQIEADGDYRFTTKSSYDRNVLIIDGKEVCPFGDGEQAVTTVRLKKGWVQIISVGFAASGGESGITVRWQPPGQSELGPIPLRLLTHEGAGRSLVIARPTEAKAPLKLSIEGPTGFFSDCLAREIIMVADDFVVEAYHNGERISDERRKLLEEVFGATVERIDLQFRPGDWLVFHVVNNRMRWDGAKYFAVAGTQGRDKFGFVSDPASSAWSVCDDPAMAAAFIKNRHEGTEIRAGALAKPWDQGDAQMRKHAGDRFPGKGLWGGAQSTWIKYVAPRDAKPLPVIVSPTPAVKVPDPKKKAAEKKDVPAKPATLAAQAPKLPVDPTRWPVQVLSAIYGTGGKNADVTVRVKDLVEVQRKWFAVNPPTLGADPNPYWNKELWVLYMKDGVRREKRWGENGHVLPETFYGPQDAPELTKWLPATRWRGAPGEMQFHASHAVTGVGMEGAPVWEALAHDKVRITWSAERKVEYDFDYTWSSFHEKGNAAVVYHVVK